MVVVVAVGVFLVHKTVNKQVSGGDGDDDVAAADHDHNASIHGGSEACTAAAAAAMATTDNRDLLLPILRQMLSFCSFLGRIGSFRVGSVQAFRMVMRTASEASAGVGVGSFWMTCAFQWDFYQRFVLVAVLPVLIAFLCIIGVRIGFVRASWRTVCRVWSTASTKLVDPHERRIRCFLDASIVYCLYMAFPTVTEQLFHALRCTDVRLVADGGKVSVSVLTADFRVSCLHNAKYDAVHGIGAGLVALYVLAPPVVLAWWIRRNREYLTDEMSMRRFGFLYRGYRLDAFPWWGCVSLLSKVAVTAIVVFLDKELEQMVSALFVFSVLVLLQMAAKPFEKAMLNNLQVFAYVSLAVTQFVPIYLSVKEQEQQIVQVLAHEQEQQQQLGEAAALPMSIGLVAVNGAVIIAYLVCAWKERGTAMVKARAKVRGALVVLQRRCCCCCCGGGIGQAEARRGSLHEDLLGDMGLSTHEVLVHQSDRSLPQEEKSP
jgi:hypothetical protein